MYVVSSIEKNSLFNLRYFFVISATYMSTITFNII